MSKKMTIHQVAEVLGVSTKTLRRWEESNLFTPERDPHTNIRLYHPYLVEYWKKLLTINREISSHLKKLDPIRKDLNKHIVMKPLSPGEKIPMLDIEGFSKANDAMEEWEAEYDKLIKDFFEFPDMMQKAIHQMEQEEK